jgi:hypothetical protein
MRGAVPTAPLRLHGVAFGKELLCNIYAVIAYISTSIGQSFSNQVFYWTFLHNMGQ